MRFLNSFLVVPSFVLKSRSVSCTFRLQKSRVLHFRRIQSVPSKFLFSTLSSPQNTVDNGIKQLIKEFPSPKRILWRVINEAFCIHQNAEIKPVIAMHQVSCGNNNQKMWHVTLSMNWPEKFQVSGVAGRKTEAENIAYIYACQKMRIYGILDEKNDVILPKNIITSSDMSIKTAKGELLNIYQRIWTKYGRKDYIPRFMNSHIGGVFGNERCWKSVLHLMYPEQKSFDGYALRVKDAESIAATRAIQWLFEQGIISRKRSLVECSKEDEQKLLELHSAPCSVYIPEALQEKMANLLNNVQEANEILPNENSECEEAKDQDIVPEIYDIITENLYHEPSEEDIIGRSREMFEKTVSLKENSDPEFQEILSAKVNLPINAKREHILKLLDENQVVVLSGETGSGKTTQVPQFILDHYVSQMKGALCNIVVTQPRRISAITMAERVAAERGEKVGETVGYQIRLNKNLPKRKGAILFCSTGMLLRKLSHNPNAAGVSHIIVDEVHERNIPIDFLLILLKKLMEQNKDIKILLMSATFNTHTFSQYFNNCPVIHIPGKIYPVREYFLEDLDEKDIPSVNYDRRGEAQLNVDLVVDAINYIDTHEKPGAILCFLPGWHDIQAVSSKLQNCHKDPTKLMICPAHSRLPPEEQKNIFKKPAEGCRKVILATNIAETSITVDDVVYVVNSGLYKGTHFDSEYGVASLSTHWVTKANVRQRRGRAGRVQPGVCYHLFYRKDLMKMDDYPLPELLRMPLESIILDCKLYCPDTKAEDFLSLALQPPLRSSVHLGISELQCSGILDEEENLTDLGKLVVNFATHPRLSVALIYAAFLGCLDPVLTICALITSGKEPFVNTLENKSVMKDVKKNHDNFLYSDHVSLCKIYDTWKTLTEKSEAAEYITKCQLDDQSLTLVQQLKGLFAEDLYSTGVIDKPLAFSDPLHDCNTNHKHIPTVLAVLAAAFYPNVMKIIQGDIHNGRLKKDVITYTLLKGRRGYVQKESVASHEHELPSPWFVYFSGLKSEARRLMMTPSVSSVPSICLLLFAGQKLFLQLPADDKTEDKSAILLVDDSSKLNFSCSKKEALLLLKFRNHLNEAFKAYVGTFQRPPKEGSTTFRSDVVPILKELLETPQVPFTKGCVHKFVNGDLVTEEW